MSEPPILRCFEILPMFFTHQFSDGVTTAPKEAAFSADNLVVTNGHHGPLGERLLSLLSGLRSSRLTIACVGAEGIDCFA